jgi:hypothetical protein
VSDPTGAETRPVDLIANTLERETNFDQAYCFALATHIEGDLHAAGLTITPAEVAASDGVTVSRKVLRVLIDAAEPKGMVTTGPQTQRIRLAIQTAQSALRSSAPATTERE